MDLPRLHNDILIRRHVNSMGPASSVFHSVSARIHSWLHGSRKLKRHGHSTNHWNHFTRKQNRAFAITLAVHHGLPESLFWAAHGLWWLPVCSHDWTTTVWSVLPITHRDGQGACGDHVLSAKLLNVKRTDKIQIPNSPTIVLDAWRGLLTSGAKAESWEPWVLSRHSMNPSNENHMSRMPGWLVQKMSWTKWQQWILRAFSSRPKHIAQPVRILISWDVLGTKGPMNERDQNIHRITYSNLWLPMAAISVKLCVTMCHNILYN